MKKMLTLVLTLSLVLSLCAACSSNSETRQTVKETETVQEKETVVEETESPDEIAYEKANALYDSGDYSEALVEYRSISNPDSFSDVHDRIYECANIERQQKKLTQTVTELRGKLKDPNSLTIYDYEFFGKTEKEEEHGTIIDYKMCVLEYGATNSFGGMVRDTYVKLFVSLQNLTEDELAIYMKYN